MPIPILPTKLYPPSPRDGWVSRHILMDRLRTGISGKVTILSAPPGFGKTTLLSAWLGTTDHTKVAWYSLDEDDNEPGRFFLFISPHLYARSSLILYPLLPLCWNIIPQTHAN